jgi:glucan phosphoethanolaminetransferase (alkaline phosphatase superfamily)
MRSISLPADKLIRLALFVSALSPTLVWPLSGHTLAHPLHVFVWALSCSLLASFTPEKFTRLLLIVQIFALPVTIAWIGSVAVTGFGPSNAAFEAAQNGPLHELWSATQLASKHLSFLITSTLSIAALIWSCRLSWRKKTNVPSKFDLLFLITLIPFVCINLDALGYSQLAKFAGPEARLSIPWLYEMELAKSTITTAADRAGRISGANPDIRNAKDAPQRFIMQSGLAIFMLGDSLRADAMLVPGRGKWSEQLQKRLDLGLGVRLNDVCSGGSATSSSVPRLFTAVDPGDVEGAANNPSILALAKAAGAKTAYVSNHEMWLLPEAGHDLSQRTTTLEHQSFDETAVEVFADFVKKTSPGPKAAILHLYGQHFLYEERYPHNEFPPLPNNLSAESLAELHYARAAEYGNKALLDAAEILDSQSTPSFLIFTSDHAENLPSDKTGKKYHALPSSGKNDTTVPAIVLWNAAFKQAGKDQLLAPLTSSNGLIAHRDLANAWLILAGMPGQITATKNPTTWGALNPGESNRVLSCAELHP